MTPETREELARAMKPNERDELMIEIGLHYVLRSPPSVTTGALAPIIERLVAERVAALTAERDAAMDFYNMAKSNTADYERVVIAMGERRATAAIVAWLKGCDERACEAAAWAVERGDHLTAHKPLDT